MPGKPKKKQNEPPKAEKTERAGKPKAKKPRNPGARRKS